MRGKKSNFFLKSFEDFFYKSNFLMSLDKYSSDSMIDIILGQLLIGKQQLFTKINPL